MFLIFRAAASCDLTLVICKEVLPATSAILPLGGSSLGQLGLIFTIAYLVNEIGEIWTGAKK